MGGTDDTLLFATVHGHQQGMVSPSMCTGGSRVSWIQMSLQIDGGNDPQSPVCRAGAAGVENLCRVNTGNSSPHVSRTRAFRDLVAEIK